MADDDLVIGDDDGDVIPKDDRVLPPTVETVTYDARGEAHVTPGAEPYFWARAYHNQPGWNLWAVATDEVRDGDKVVQPERHREGWVPNNEEGVRAVELGFVKIADAPTDAPPMPHAPELDQRPVLDL